MKLGIPREVRTEERRVAVAPRTVERLCKLGFDIQVEAGAGALANCSDAKYIESGATISSGADIWQQCDIVLKVEPPSDIEISSMRPGQILLGMIWPANNEPVLASLHCHRI